MRHFCFILFTLIACTVFRTAFAGYCNTYETYQKTCTKSESFTQKCGGFWRRRRRCTRYRVKTFACTATRLKKACCQGYTGSTCTTSLCFGKTTCPNRGTCIQPNVCKCPTGYNKPRCDVVTCGKPPSLMNGNMQGSVYTYNHQVKYVCNAKYKLKGTSVRTCTALGVWTGSTPTCHFVASCESSPCKNKAPCTNLLDDYSCLCINGWTGKNCETDIQPPVIAACPTDMFSFETELEVTKEWQIPSIEDPFGNHVDVTSNYAGNSFTFPWGDFTVQYKAVKPSNGLKAECTFNIGIRPHPCKALPIPSNGIVVCNNWRTEYASVCMALCKDGYVFATGVNFQWYNCGATGNWLPPPVPLKCVPDDVLSVTLDADLPRLSRCTAAVEKQALGHFYVQKLKASQFNILCLDYRSHCDATNVAIRC